MLMQSESDCLERNRTAGLPVSPDDPMLDSRLFEPVEDEAELRAVFKKGVGKVILESSSYCNRKCSYCPQILRTEKVLMDDELFRSVIRQLKSIDYDKQFVLHLFNEPLAFAEKLLERIAYIKRELPRSNVYFSTNGDYLNRDIMERLAAAGLSSMTVSIHPGRNFDNARLLNRFFSMARRLDIDVHFKSYEQGVCIVAEAMFREIPMKIRATDFTQRGSNRAGLVDNVVQISDRTLACKIPFSIFTVGYDGTVFPCYHMVAGVETHARYAVQRLTPQDSIFAAFNHEVLRRWRREVFLDGPKQEPCNSCRLDFIRLTDEQLDARRAFLDDLDCRN